MLSTGKAKFVRTTGKWVLALSALGVVTYPIIIKPMMDPREYKEMQKIGRAGIVQEKIQPGNMKVWSDPFQSRK